MVTNAVNMDLKVNAPNGAKQRDGDSGFSDVLGNVSSENERRQPGLTNSGRNNDFGKEFGYTKRASESVRGTDPGTPDNQQQLSDIGTKLRQAGIDSDTADRILSQAAETVAREVAETGETPTKEEAAGMMAEALREMLPKKILVVPEKTKAAETSEEPVDDLIEVLADVIAAMAGEPETETQQVGIQAEETDIPVDEPAVHVLTPDSSFILTEKHVEAAMISGSDEEFVPVMRDDSGENVSFSEELGMMMQTDGEEMSPEDAQLLAFTENAREMFTGRTRFSEDTVDFTDRSDLLTKVLAKLENESTETGGPIAELPAVKDTAVMLGEIIGKAKQELGLTEVKYERVTGEQDAAVPLMQDESVKLSRSMNRSDRTLELGHILGEDKAPDVKEESDAPKTETYDAVHMSAHLMQDRTDTDIPLEKLEETAQRTEIRPPEVQAAEQILERIRNMQDDHMEFTMVLNPESLGRITVRLVMAGEKTAVEITAENPETRAILASRTENMQSMLRDNGVDLERYQVVSEQEDARFEQQSYEGSSKNPYSRDDGEENREPDDENGESFYDLLGKL